MQTINELSHICIYYNCIVGSKTYGVDIEDSDEDILYIWDNDLKKRMIGHTHIIGYTPESFNVHVPIPSIDRLPYLIQWLFPDRFLMDTELSRLVLDIREDIIKSARKEVYEGFMEKADGLSYRINEMYQGFPKRAAYSCLFYEMIYRHANGATFAEVHKPEEDFRQWLIAVRKKEIDIREVESRNNQLRNKATSVKGFYQTDKDEKFLSEFEMQYKKIMSIG